MEEANNIDPKKLFNKKEYSTLIIGKEEEEKKGKSKTEILVDILVSNEHKDIKHDALQTLKTNNGLELLIDAIQNPKNKKHKTILVAACWEAGFDCSKYLTLFINIALTEDFMTCLEAVTVIEEMQGPFDSKEFSETKLNIKKGIEKKDDKAELYKTILESLELKQE